MVINLYRERKRKEFRNSRLVPCFPLLFNKILIFENTNPLKSAYMFREFPWLTNVTCYLLEISWTRHFKRSAERSLGVRIRIGGHFAVPGLYATIMAIAITITHVPKEIR